MPCLRILVCFAAMLHALQDGLAIPARQQDDIVSDLPAEKHSEPHPPINQNVSVASPVINNLERLLLPRQSTSRDIQAYLSSHNTVRARHGAVSLVWSIDLERFAGQWAANCRFAHSGGPYGGKLSYALQLLVLAFGS